MMTIRNTAHISMAAVFCSIACLQTHVAHAQSAAVLTIDVDNAVVYTYDASDYSKFASDPNLTTPISGRPFFQRLVVGDIVAVNGNPAKGLLVERAIDVLAMPNLMAGRPIADLQRAIVQDDTFEILQANGTPVGTIMTAGLGGGAVPPGAPSASTQSNFTVIGGTGAFLGVRGQAGYVSVSRRFASVTEDPANRRILGGAPRRFVLHLILQSQPHVVVTPNGPAVTHSSDFALVTASKPAAAGEILSLFATGLGPTKPGVDPGQPFPSSPLAAVNSPVQVTVNGKSADVLAAVGVPGAMDGYQVNFRVPLDTAKGTATIQISVAWIAGAPVTIPVQ
jgi:hypothetical protein